jgi:hypothetical protein
MKSPSTLLTLLLCAAAGSSLASANICAADWQQPLQTTQSQSEQQAPANQGQPQQPDPDGQGSGDQNPADARTASNTLQQAQEAASQQLVPLRDEPHHHLVMQNDLVRVYSVGVPPNDATANHQHDHPYLAINFGAATIENDVQGKPPANLQLADGQLVYSPGGFAHVARTSGVAFHNITIELRQPQQNARDLCKQIIAGPLSCAHDEAAHENTTEMADARKRIPSTASRGKTAPPSANSPAKSPSEAADDVVPYFETDQVRADVVTVSSGRDYVEESPKFPALLVAMTNSNIDVNLVGQHVSFLHTGDTVWMPAGTNRRVTDFLGTRSNFLLVTFKDASNAAPPPQ